MFRSQKMEAVGQLTGGIAHDFNNILAIILGNIELLKLKLPSEPFTDEIIETVLRATLHGKELTSHLLAFSRSRLLNPQPVSLNVLVADIVRLLGRTLGATIRITTAMGRDAGVAFVDPSALEAAVLNVALNARDAMPDGGTLTIRTSKVTITDMQATEDDLKPGVVRDARDRGYGLRHVARGCGTRVRAVLHHEGRRPRHRAGFEHGLRFHEAVGRRRDDCLDAWSRHYREDLPSGCRERAADGPERGSARCAGRRSHHPRRRGRSGRPEHRAPAAREPWAPRSRRRERRRSAADRHRARPPSICW